MVARCILDCRFNSARYKLCYVLWVDREMCFERSEVMPAPNEELILKLRGQAYTTCRPDQLCDQAADLLQSQAERIKELEKQHIERLLRIEKEVDVLVAERDELREKYTDTYWALDDAARENTSLRAQLTESISNHEACTSANTMLLDEIAAIDATEPVAYMVQFSPGSRWVELTKEEFDSDLDGHIVYKKQAFFTRPMPAQDVTELVEALQLFADALPLERSTIKTCYAVTDQMRDSVHAALAKHRGAK